MTDTNQKIYKGIKLGKNESALDALQKAVPHWIHEKKEDPTSVTGYLYARECRCSNCGFLVSFEKEYCPHCRKKMQKMKGL